MDTSSTRRAGRAAEQSVIVLGAHYGGLSVVRALGQNGLKTILVTSHPHDHACHSKYVSELVLAPEPAAHAQELLEVLMDPRKDWDGLLLIPTLDEYAIFISQNRQRLSQRFVFTIQDWDTVNRIIYKNNLYPAAAKQGIPVPRVLTPVSLDDLHQHRGDFSYPCILKPYESRQFSETYGAKVLVARDFEDLVEKYVDTQRHKLGVMICEIIPGDDSTIFSHRVYIDSQGELLAEMWTQKIRQYPPGFGQGAVQRSIPLIPAASELSLKLLRSFDYRGQATTEFRLDCRDNQYKLMEINIRPAVAEWLFVSAGMNFPYMTYLDLIKGVREHQSSYRLEVYWIHNHWEAVNFINSLSNGTLKLREFLDPYWKNKVFVMPFFEDPVNFLMEMWQNVTRLWKKMRNRRLWRAASNVKPSA